MGETTGISWTDHTFNTWWGCDRVSPACDHCYAADLAGFRMAGVEVWGKDAPRRIMSEHYWNDPRRWNRAAEKDGVRRRVFCSSMADVFEDFTGPMVTAKGEPVPDRTVEGERTRLFQLILDTPNLDWLLLTKRPQNIAKYLPAEWLDDPPFNLWLGTTVENQRWANVRVPKLINSLRVPASVYFLSYEPGLDGVDLGQWFVDGGVNWVILGGESGSQARPFDLGWARDVLNQVREAGTSVAYFMKQLGQLWAKANRASHLHGAAPRDWPADLRVQEFPTPRIARPDEALEQVATLL